MFRCLNRATSTNKVYLSQNVCRAAIFHGRLMSQQAKIKPELKDQKPTSQRLSNEQQVPSEPGKSIDQPTPIEQPLNDQQVALEHQPNDLQLPYERVPIVQYPPNYQIPTHESQAVWRRIYHLHEMKYFSIISKLKFLPIITGVVLSPIGGILQILEILPNTTSSIITAPLILGKYCATAGLELHILLKRIQTTTRWNDISISYSFYAICQYFRRRQNCASLCV